MVSSDQVGRPVAWALEGEVLMEMLERAHKGEKPEDIYMEYYANLEHISEDGADMGDQERIAALEAEVRELRISVEEFRLWQETGQAHKWCPKCLQYIRTFGPVYVQHTKASATKEHCDNSLQAWR